MTDRADTSENPSIAEIIKRLDNRRTVRRDRTAEYMARADEHMAGMDRAAQLEFLRAEFKKWFARYQRFQAEVFSGIPVQSDVTAWDYSETIATISARIARLEREQVSA